MTTPLDTLKALRATLPTPMANDQIGELLNEVAWVHRLEGWGLLSKPAGANCHQPQTLILISRDILMQPDGRIWDVLLDAEGQGKPTWHPKEPLDPSRLVAPIDASVVIALPPVVIVPPVPRPDFPQRYPDEHTWWTSTLGEIGTLYEQKGEGFNLGMFKWSARIAYDIGTGMEKDRSKAKHLAELRRALGL